MPRKLSDLTLSFHEYACPHCGSHNKCRNGWFQENMRFLCKDCGKNYLRDKRPVRSRIIKIKFLESYLDTSNKKPIKYIGDEKRAVYKISIKSVAHETEISRTTAYKYIREFQDRLNNLPDDVIKRLIVLTKTKNLSIKTIQNNLPKNHIKELLNLLYSE